MLEDRLKEVENLWVSPEDLRNDLIGAGYLKVANTVSFADIFTYVIKLPISEHWKPEVKAAKRNEVKNLMDYETFEEVHDEGQYTIGVDG